MQTVSIRNALVMNEGERFEANLFIKDGLIYNIDSIQRNRIADRTIDAQGMLLTPGCIDDQVHFREPGLTHKATIYSESRAGVAGGITSFMEMPNTNPATTTIERLEAKFARAAETSLANYSFFLGASNDNTEELLRLDVNKVCGVKIFMGSSTGNLLVDNEEALDSIFSNVRTLIAVHCEDDKLIKENLERYKKEYGDNIPASAHPYIRDAEACYRSSKHAVELARKHQTRLHILHISTARELELFDNTIPLSQKHITAEACVHHLWFSEGDYEQKGMFIKWNPAVKTENDRLALIQGVISNKIDVIATDHAPHTLEEKALPYAQAPSGAPLVQHAWVTMLELYHQGKIPLETIVEKMCHAPASLFQIDRRGYVREGYWADLVLTDLNRTWTVDRPSVLYQCGWSPLEGQTFHAQVQHTLVNGNVVYAQGAWNETNRGKRLNFLRK